MYRFILPPLRNYQIDLVRDDSPEVACVSSTQVGKTFTYACKILAQMWEHRSHLSWWWCAPSYKQSRAAQREMYRIASSARILARGPKPPFEQNPPPALVLVNGSTCEYRTWDDPSHLMGDPIAGAVIDEGGLLTDEAYAAISTRRSATLGPLWWIGNPGVKTGIFRKVCAKAEEEGRLHRWSWQTLYSWYEKADPEFAQRYRAFIESERRDMPDFEFRRLYEAEWTEDEAAVFRNVQECTSGVPSDHANGDTYVIGLDVAQQQDYLVAMVLSVRGYRAVTMDRMRGVSYPLAAERVKELQTRFGNAPVIVEINGPGVAVAQEFDRIGVSYVPFTTTAQSKQQLILPLAADFQEKRISLAEMPPLQHELSVFRYERSSSGVTYRYEAPSGEHDDTVMALALAAWQRARTGYSAIEWLA